MLFTLSQYLLTLGNSEGLTRTLGRIELCRDADGRPQYFAGNSAIVFRILHRGCCRALRCYTRTPRHLGCCYPGKVLLGELYLFTGDGGRWVDAVLDDWIEGETLQRRVGQAAAAEDRATLSGLARAFDRLAAGLLAAPWAHGDLKPENIVVTPGGALRLIDFDMRYVPELGGMPSPGLGTAAFQHPARSVADYNRYIDDYPAALIAAALHALALRPQLWTDYPEPDGLLLHARRIAAGACPAYEAVLRLFAEAGDAAAWTLARLLAWPRLRLPGLVETMRFLAVRDDVPLPAAVPEPFLRNGRCGYRIGGRMTIPPIFDDALPFRRGCAAVRIGSR